MPQTVVVLFAHGARSPEWSAPLHALQEAMRARGLHAELAFLELQPPSLPEVLDTLAPHHALVQVLPVFWAEAGHVRNELSAMLAAARARHPGVHFTQLPTLSQVPGLIALLADFVAGCTGRER
jgi:sirohydrochlorin cobaltochelatase